MKLSGEIEFGRKAFVGNTSEPTSLDAFLSKSRLRSELILKPDALCIEDSGCSKVRRRSTEFACNYLSAFQGGDGKVAFVAFNDLLNDLESNVSKILDVLLKDIPNPFV